MICLENEILIGKLAERLKKDGLRMCTAESCTGGLVAAMCTSLAGSSDWFSGGIVSYSNEMKMQILGVPQEILEEHGAVSIPVVEQMCRGAMLACGASAAVAVSGVAGPGGGSAEKPVGTVCLAVSLQAEGEGAPRISSLTELFDGDRAQVRAASARRGLEMLLGLLD